MAKDKLTEFNNKFKIDYQQAEAIFEFFKIILKKESNKAKIYLNTQSSVTREGELLEWDGRCFKFEMKKPFVFKFNTTLLQIFF